MTQVKLLCALIATIVAVAGNVVTASVHTFTLETPENYGSDLLRVIVDVDNNTADKLTFKVTIQPNGTLTNTGDLLGVFLEFNPHPTLSTTIGVSFAGSDITSVQLNTLNAGGGNNLNGTIASLVPGGTFDAALTLGRSGSSSGLLTSTIFTLDDNGGAIELDDLIGVGIRAQTVGLPPTGGGGSSKLYSENYEIVIDPDGEPTVPEPSSLAVFSLLAMIGGAGYWRKRKG